MQNQTQNGWHYNLTTNDFGVFEIQNLSLK